MKKTIKKIHNLTLEVSALVSKKEFGDIVEEDVDTLGEAIDLLNDLYETLYDEVFVEVEE